MREGPPPPTVEAPTQAQSFSSTTTLLKEITTLRSRLKDLEDDTRSSISMDYQENHFNNVLKKELAKVEQDKADLEREFMNQMASLAVENQKAIKAVEEKLHESEASNKELRNKLSEAAFASVDTGDEKERLAKLLADEREVHAREIEQLKNTIAATDMEIAESRREMDHLHEELDEIQSHKDALLDQTTKLRIDLNEAQQNSESLRAEAKDLRQSKVKLENEIEQKMALVERKRQELVEVKDALAQAHSDKHKLSAENTDFRRQVERESTKSFELSSRVRELQKGNQKTAALSDKKRSLQGEVRQLEQTLAETWEGMKRKDDQIDELKSQLKEERQSVQFLKGEIKEVQDERARLEIKANAPASNELYLLRKQNRKLTDEVKTLRLQDRDVRLNSPARRRPSSSEKQNWFFPPVAVERQEAIPRTPPSKKVRPRTPVQGLVASYEQRISGRFRSEESMTSSFFPPPLAPSSSAEGETDDSTRDTEIEELRESLRKESQRVLELRAEINASKNQREVDRLTVRVEQYEIEIAKYEEKLRYDRSEIQRVKLQLERAQQDRRELEKVMASRDLEIQQLNDDIIQIQKSSSLQGEKREKQQAQEILEQRSQINHLQADMERTFEDISKKNKEIDSLRTEITFIKSQYNSSQQDAREYASEIQELQKARATREDEVKELKKEIRAIKEREGQKALQQRSQIKDLQADIERASEDIATRDEEIEDLRTEITSIQSQYDDSMRDARKYASEIEKLQKVMAGRDHEVQQLNQDIIDIKEKNALKEEEGQKQEADKIQVLRSEIDDLRTEIERSSEEIARRDEEIDILHTQISSLQSGYDISLHDATKYSSEIQNLKKLLEEAQDNCAQEKAKANEAHHEEIEKLTDELTQAQLAQSENDTTWSDRLTEIEKEMQKLESNAEDEIEKLRVQLKKAELISSEKDLAHSAKIEKLEEELETLEKSGAKETLKLRLELEEMQAALSKKSEDIQRLESEKGHMTRVTNSRKIEIDELQTELIDLTAKTGSQLREIQVLKMRIEDHEAFKLEREKKHQHRVLGLEEEIRTVRMDATAAQGEDMERLQSENQTLRDSMRIVKCERRALEERLDSIMSERSTSKSAQVLRDRNTALKGEVEKLTKRLKKMESSITRFAI